MVAFALSILGGIVIMARQIHKIHAFFHFLTLGTSLPLAFLLVPIEVISFI